jgi:GNAT superfamily N-acetyltransferase
MDIRYRALEESDLAPATDVFLTALTDMARRNGLPPPTAYTPEYVYPRFAHLSRTGIFRVAEADGKVVSICAAIVRDQLWFLSMFWTLPEWQQRGVGKPLLQQVWQAGRDRGARLDFTWSSVDYAALGTYLKLGMLPVCQILTFAGRPSALAEPPAGHALEPLDDATAARLDAEILGARRDVDHEFWRNSSAARYQVRAREGVVGAFYTGGGTIGPAAWTDPAHAPPVLRFALREASLQSPEIRLMTAGVNHAAVRAACAAGLRIATAAHLLCSGSLGAIDRYLPSGPALF